MNLYISDLDGTLLNSNREISIYSKNVINNLIAKGMNFTIATARTPGTVVEILEGINVNKAIALMNGVFLYDLDKIYFEERKCSKYKTFEVVTNYYEAIENLQVVNFMILDKEEVIKVIFEELNKIEGINVGYYKDVYDETCYFIEIHSAQASKKQAVADLRELYSPEKVVCFGDNLNDLPMFEVADEKYAMENAVAGLKTFATAIIDSNDNDGVAKYLEQNLK